MNNRNKSWKLLGLIITLLLVLTAAVVIGMGLAQGDNDASDSTEEVASEGQSTGEDEARETDDSAEEVTEEPEETFTDIRISAVGDVMGHMSQIISAYDAESDSYDFTPVFADVKPYIEEADLAIANLETTLAGSARTYAGYPAFNTPDAIIDALDFAGFDTLITTNNHSLDTGPDGLRRTVEVIEDRGLEPVGTYAEEPASRVHLKNVEGIEIAVLAYTEHLNGLEASYSAEQLDAMVNVISEERILADIAEAKEAEPDLILTYMHWGQEYTREPNDFQNQWAEFLTKEGVDIIIGSHPHVIHETTLLEVDGNETVVAYSLGNFVSNQRRETLGAGYEPTEDGVILNIDIQKNDQTGETSVTQVDYTPTWVYRNRYSGDANYTYRILPVESALESGEFNEDINNRLRQSLEETRSRMNLEDD
ncbi:Capsule biosynthesis protein capA [Alkalibacterium sp. AK22]|uniref:CapA family protein n=1 Tax=Alkalibacterium sp. AK22 TaxID=1229520 RepID=UPI0004482E94|nr:CapA family protein [Alkalibacterium sp. AK22]EXJ22950.1 Capsule biosynthesis protein capA [Alkalibacterium sp. AK22]